MTRKPGPITALVAALVLCALAQPLPAAARAPAQVPPETPLPLGPLGVAALLDDRSILDHLELRLSGIAPAPPGAIYRVWLRSDDQALVESPGDVAAGENGEASFAWSQPAGEALLIQYSEVLVTLETDAPAARGARPGSVVLAGRLDRGALTQFRRLLVRWPDSRYGTASLQGLRLLAANAQTQAAVLRQATADGDLAAMRRKAEHLVNLVEGARGAAFGDLDGDGRAEDPGDGVGLLPYVWGALTQTQFAWATAADDQVAEAALAVQPALRFALAWAGFVRDIGLELAQTHDVARARELAGPLSIAVQRIAAAVDPGADAALQQVVEEGELTPAYVGALGLLQVPLLPPAAPSTPGTTTVTTGTAANGG